MGVGPVALELYEKLLRAGLMHPGMAMLELGSQDNVPGPYRGRLYRPSHAMPSARDLMRTIGIADYECVDLDGRHGAHQIDLNTCSPFVMGECCYDIVTNHGTSEHVFNQPGVFTFMHVACNVGGIIIHVLPVRGYPQHGMFLYGERFFEALICHNRYKVLENYEREDVFGTVRVLVLRRGAHDFCYPAQIGYEAPTLTRWQRLLRSLGA